MDRKTPYALWLHALILILAGVGLIGLSIFVRHIHEYGEGALSLRFLTWLRDLTTLEELLREFGFAVLIAFLVTILVELRLRNLQIQERKIEDENLRRDALNAILNITAPKQVVDKALNISLNAKFYGRGYRAQYFFEKGVTC